MAPLAPTIYLAHTSPALTSIWRWHSLTWRFCNHPFTNYRTYFRFACCADLVVHLKCLDKWAKSTVTWKFDGVHMLKGQGVGCPDCDTPFRREHLRAKVLREARKVVPTWPLGLRVDLQTREYVPVCCVRDGETVATPPGLCGCVTTSTSAQIGDKSTSIAATSGAELDMMSVEYYEQFLEKVFGGQIFAHGDFRAVPAYVYVQRFSNKGRLERA